MQFLYSYLRKMARLHPPYVGTKLLTLLQLQVCIHTINRSIVLSYTIHVMQNSSSFTCNVFQPISIMKLLCSTFRAPIGLLKSNAAPS